MAFALADALGESGRQYFHRLSCFYPSYDEKEADKQFTACLRSHGSRITINTLFHLAKQSGIKPVRNTISTYHEKLKSISPFSTNSPHGETGETEEFEETESSQSSESSDPMPTFSQDIYGLLPSFLTQIINKAKNFEDADLLILGSLTVISACLPNISGNYAEREVFPDLFTFISAQASAGKGRLTLCRHLVKPIHNNLKKIYSAEMEEYRHLLNDYSQDKKNREPPTEPPIKTLLIPANSSATSVYQVLNDNGGVGLIFETEGDTLANTFKSDYGNFSDGFRKAFHHEMISYTRRKDREFVELTKPRLSALLSGTRNILRYAPLYYPTYKIEINSGSQFIFSITYQDENVQGDMEMSKNNHKNVQGKMSKDVPELTNEELSLLPYESKRALDKINWRRQAIISIIAKDSHASIKFMAEQLNVTVKTIWRDLAELKSCGIIERVGDEFTGEWRIISH